MSVSKPCSNNYLVNNPYVECLANDILYHFGLDTVHTDIRKTFGHVKFVCTGGTASRMEILANYLAQELNIPDYKCSNLSKSDRYTMMLVGPVLCINHGIGSASLSIMLHETFKLLYHAACKDVTFVRIGSSGGIGIEPGTTVITNRALNGLLESVYERDVLGKRLLLPAKLDAKLADELFEFCKSMSLPVVQGATMCANDFYEGQARMDGSTCCFDEKAKFEFLNQLYDSGVRNIEMESTCFAAMTHAVNVRAAVVCVTLLDRLQGDQVTISSDKSVYHEFEKRPIKLLSAFIKSKLNDYKH